MRFELLACVLALVLVSACRSGGQAESDDGSETESETSGGSDTGFPIPDACSSAMPCEAGYCVAAWDASAEPPRGPAECVAECVGELDLDRFCIGDASCCDELECSLDGLCEPPWQPGTDSDSETETGSDTETDSETETDSGSETG